MDPIEHYESIRANLHYEEGYSIDIEDAADQIMQASRQGRAIFLRNGGPEVVIEDGSSRLYLAVRFPGYDQGAVIDPRTLHAPSPLELLARQAD